MGATIIILILAAAILAIWIWIIYVFFFEIRTDKIKENKNLFMVSAATVGISLIIFIIGFNCRQSVIETIKYIDTAKSMNKKDSIASTISDTIKEFNVASLFYYLPKSLIKIQCSVTVAVSYNIDTVKSAKISEQNFTVSEERIPDTKVTFLLNYTSSIFAYDSIGFKINSIGLLNSVNVIAKEKSFDIISGFFDSTKKVKSNESINTNLSDKTDSPKTDNQKNNTERINIIYTKDFYIESNSINSNGHTLIWSIKIPDYGNHYFPVNADFTIKAEDNQPDKTVFLKNDFKIDGVLTRPLRNTSLIISSNMEKGTAEKIYNFISIDASKLIVVPIERTPFLSRTNRLVFENGVLISNEIINTSSLSGFAPIPYRIFKIINGLPFP